MENNIDIAFITSNTTKLAHARYICRDYNVNILHYKRLFYGKGYVEPRIDNQEELLKDSITDAIERWKKNVDNKGNRLFFIEDTSVRIDALSNNDISIPGVDIKYWMQENNFRKLDKELKEKGNNRKASVSSHIILFLTNEIKEKYDKKEDYIIFSSTIHGNIIDGEKVFETQILYPWLDNKSFNKWFAPEGYSNPLSLLEIKEADKVDFRKGAFHKMLHFLQEYIGIGKTSPKVNQVFYKINFRPIYIICGPTCAGKSSVGKLLLEKYEYFHVEASDFMTLRYYETHGTKFIIDKNIYASEVLKIDPYFVVNNSYKFIDTKNIADNLVITGFRTMDEVNYFKHIFPIKDTVLIYIDSDLNIRFERWKKRKRDVVEYSFERFKEINKIQEKMGLSQIKQTEETIIFDNNKEGLDLFYADFINSVIKEKISPFQIDFQTVLSSRSIPLEKAILIILAIEYNKDDTLYYTTTEISHLIDKSFVYIKKNKNNISRYFNQSYHIFYEIKKEGRKLKYKLSPTGYSEAIFYIKNTIKP